MENNQKNNLQTSEACELTILSPHTEIKGDFTVQSETHLYGKILGNITGKSGSRVVLKDGCHIEGNITADTIIVEGFMKGEITAQTLLRVTKHGKVFGVARAQNLSIDPGAIFDCKVIS